MKKHLIPLMMLCAPLLSTAQVGIGTTTPNSKAVLDLSSSTQGFLGPRMTGLQKSQMQLTADDAGMMLYQTDVPQPPLPATPKGLYYFDGSAWIAPIPNGTAIGQTLRWDGNKWASTNNLFNQGSSMGIGTVAPNSQLHIHSAASPNTRIQLTNNTTGALSADGFMLGISQADGFAHLLQNESKPICISTNATERLRIDASGNVGIGTNAPQAMLDVTGTVRIGSAGSILHSILKETFEVQIDPLAYGAEGVVNIPFSNTLENASVYVSPATAMAGLMIAYARVSAPGNVEVKFMNMNPDMEDPLTVTLHISVIQ